MEFIHETIKKDDDLAVKIKILDTDLFKKGLVGGVKTLASQC